MHPELDREPSAAPRKPTRRNGREAIRPEELTDAEIELIARSEVPAEYADLDEELADWRP